MSQWAEIRHLHLVEGVPKKEISRRMELDVKTVRRAIERSSPPERQQAERRPRALDQYREKIESLLRADRRISAKRIGRLLEQEDQVVVKPRTLRHYVSEVRRELRSREAFVHRTHAPGKTLEVDFGETVAMIGGKRMRLKFLVATLPASNAYFAKAYPTERLECLLDGLNAAFRHFGGVTERVVIDNTSVAVREVRLGTERLETAGFAGYRGSLPIRVDFCAPGKGWEKGAVEGGVDYVRGNCFRPMATADTLDQLNQQILEELTIDQGRRRLDDGQLVDDALAEECKLLRPLPDRLPETCRLQHRSIDKFGHVREDYVRYSVPIEHAYKPAIVKLYHDRVEIVVDHEVVARHERSYDRGSLQLNPHHILPLLAKKHRAVDEATALLNWDLPPVFAELRAALSKVTRRADREWIEILQLIEQFGQGAVAQSARSAVDQGSPRLETIRLLLRSADQVVPQPSPVPVRDDLGLINVAEPDLAKYDELVAMS